MPKLFFLLSFIALLCGCGSLNSVYVVKPASQYDKFSYQEKATYLGSLHEANMRNYRAFTNGQFKSVKFIGGVK